MRRIERLHAVGELLRDAAPHPLSAATLAARLGVSRRTIERDLETLRLAGVPLYGLAGRRGGTAIVGSGPPRPIAFSTAEIMALVLAAHVAADAPYAAAGATAVDRLLGALAAPERLAVEALRARFRLAPGDDPAVRPRVRSVVEDAVRSQTVVRLRYVDRNGAPTRRAVDPVGFYLDGDRWWLVGWCHLRAGGRMFRLDRIVGADPTTRPSTPRDLDEVLGWVPRPGRPA